MKVVWSVEAEACLAEIEDYIARDNPEAAERWVTRLIERVSPLEDFPEMGHVVPEYEDSRVRELLVRGYRIFYVVRGDTVCIATVFEGHRLPPPLDAVLDARPNDEAEPA